MSLLVILLPLIIGSAVSLLLSTRLGNARILVWIAPGIGIGITSIMFFLWSLAFYPRFRSDLYLVIEIFLAVGLAVTVLQVYISKRKKFNLTFPKIHPGVTDVLMGLALAIALFFFTYSFLKQTAENPLGGSDAWTIWNYRARFFLKGDALSWQNVFSKDVSHADYPYLLTGFIARCWVLLGKDRTFVPVVTAGLFTFSTTGLLGAFLTNFRGLRTGILASFLLVSLPVFAWTSASQYADLPLAFYYLAAVALLYLYTTERGGFSSLVAAGWSIGMALWTKNEGVSFTLSVIIVLAIFQVLRRSGWRNVLSQICFLLGGIFPLLLLYLGFRMWLVPPTDLFENRSINEIIQQVTNLSRYWTIIRTQVTAFLTWGWWKIPFLPCLVAYVIIVGVRPLPKHEWNGVLLLAAIIGLTYIQYMVIFLITPFDLSWHMSTANARLYIQLLPALLLVFFLFTRNSFNNK